MKVFTAQKIRDLEILAYKEGASEEFFMENAGRGIAEHVENFIVKKQLARLVFLLCAKGNNSGDAYVAGRYLLQSGYEVVAWQTVPLENCSSLCVKNHQKFIQAGGQCTDKPLTFPKQGVILDRLFGTGFKGTLQEPFASIVNAANISALPILAIDIPSGLNGDSGMAEGPAIQAQETICLGPPKKGFFLNDGWNHIGILRFVDFGLPKKFIEAATPDMMMLTDDYIRTHIPVVKRNWHKYEKGYVTGLAGSPDMPGASILSSWAALVAGAGIVRLVHQEGMQAELSAAPLEIVRQTYKLDHLEPVIESLNKSKAAFIGPGMGRSEESFHVLRYILAHLKQPCVIDADALTWIAEHSVVLPDQVILTPHQGEMLRLLHKDKERLNTEELLSLAMDYAKTKKITLVLKGAPTFILQEGLPIYVNPRGDPGMATAGSGDVLTGIIAAFLSHRLPPHTAALLGVYFHAVSGEWAAKSKTSYCMIASDLIHSLPEAYKELLVN